MTSSETTRSMLTFSLVTFVLPLIYFLVLTAGGDPSRHRFVGIVIIIFLSFVLSFFDLVIGRIWQGKPNTSVITLLLDIIIWFLCVIIIVTPLATWFRDELKIVLWIMLWIGFLAMMVTVLLHIKITKAPSTAFLIVVLTIGLYLIMVGLNMIGLISLSTIYDTPGIASGFDRDTIRDTIMATLDVMQGSFDRGETYTGSRIRRIVVGFFAITDILFFAIMIGIFSKKLANFSNG